MTMRAVWLVATAAALALGAKETGATCSVNSNSETLATCQEDETYSEVCAGAIKDHVKLEFSASLQYLLMGAYFGQDNVNLFGRNIGEKPSTTGPQIHNQQCVQCSVK